MDSRIELSFDLPPSSDSPARARRELDRIACRVSAEALEQARLLVTELVTNSVRHAGLEGETAIRLRVVVDGDALWSEISDAGPGFDADASRPDPGRIGGWGIYLVDQLAERWGVDRAGGHTRVWFRLPRMAPLRGGGVPGFSTAG